MKPKKTNIACTVCGNNNLITKLNLGFQPPSNRFASLNNINLNEEKFKIALGYCQDCYTPQLTQRFPRDSVRPRYDWLKYNEPEQHLDDTVGHLRQLSGIEKNDHFLGLSYKDQSTLDRLDQFGFSNSKCLTNQEYDVFDTNPLQNLKHLKVPAKLILARHVLEHADSATNVILQLKEFLDNDGYLVLEIPTNEKIFKNLHYPFLWEEHISYFTTESIQILANAVGANVAWSKCYEYEYEDSLVFALSFNNSAPDKSTTQNKHSESTIVSLEEFCRHFSSTKTKWQNTMHELKSKGNSIALFGAGHLSVKLINFFELESYFDCVIDDHPQKIGLLMPGSTLPIKPSSELVEQRIKYCFSTLNPESEQKVRRKMQSYLDIGGDFIPAFNTSMANV